MVMMVVVQFLTTQPRRELRTEAMLMMLHKGKRLSEI
jgi:hypothetical protein